MDIFTLLCKSWGHMHSIVTDYDITIPTLLSLALTQQENCTCIGTRILVLDANNNDCCVEMFPAVQLGGYASLTQLDHSESYWGMGI